MTERPRETIGAVVQARVSSRRLAGKVLLPVCGRPLLQYVIERVLHSCCRDSIVVATSVQESDGLIEDFCRQMNVACYRGSLSDVAGRLLGAAVACGFDAFVRVNGDSPLLDPELINRGVDIFSTKQFDMVTNVWPRTFPPGQSVEIVSTDAFRRAYERMSRPEHREHVTKYFYDRHGEFRIYNFTADAEFGSVHLAVDTEDDFRRVKALVGKMDKPHWTYDVAAIVAMQRESG